jgi:hypothetical protein
MGIAVGIRPTGRVPLVIFVAFVVSVVALAANVPEITPAEEMANGLVALRPALPTFAIGIPVGSCAVVAEPLRSVKAGW